MHTENEKEALMFRKNTLAVVCLIVICGLLLPASSGIAQSEKAGSAEKGKEIFDSKCTMCHTIGGGKKMGPDLKGVTERREHEWLVKFISNPEKMFEENDPIATELLKEYNGLKMPNSNLSEEQVNDVIAYIKAESETSKTNP